MSEAEANPVRDDRNQPPSAWCTWWDGVTAVTEEIYYGWPEDETHPWFWHWCPTTGRWHGAATSSHDLISRDPLHLEPSLLWPCCNLHGWVRDGRWEPA